MEAVRMHGPVFDGKAVTEGALGVKAVRDALAAEGSKLATSAFASAIRNGTGAFLSSIHVTDRSETVSTDGYSMEVSAGLESDAVTTDIASYGPWLEGTGSRNETTSFKGYHGFRMASQELGGRAEEIAWRVMAPFVERSR